MPYLKCPECTLMAAALIETWEPFGDVEDWIDELAELSADEKAALWLLAFALRDPGAEELHARDAR